MTEDAWREAQAAVWEHRDAIRGLREKMLVYGALPGVLTESVEEERWYLLRDYVSTYIERDIRLMQGVGNLDLFHRLYRSLLLQHGQILNVSNLSQDLGMGRATVRGYLNVLADTQVVHEVPSFATRLKSRAVKAPKLYLFDNGIVNHGTRQTSIEALRASGRIGLAEESLLLTQLLSVVREMSVPPEICFARDYQGRELDFIIDASNRFAVEVTTEGRLRQKRYANVETLSENLGLERCLLVGRFEELSFEKWGKVEVTLVPSFLAW
jgi:predicted AAA+ superfamily ATPase